MTGTGFDLDWRMKGSSPSLAELAYERIEELFVSARLAPGAFVRTQDLMDEVELGRTPVHQAVRRLGAETLFEVRPRDGVVVATVDLARERRLADLRRDLDRFVVAEAATRLSANHRAGFEHLARSLRAFPAVDVPTFNRFDRAFDALLIAATGERFLERTMRPLHAFARRSGYLHLTRYAGPDDMPATVAHHLAILDAVVGGDVAAAKAGSDALVDLATKMLDSLSRNAPPDVLDASLKRVHPLAAVPA